jgi:hypothetical protein
VSSRTELSRGINASFGATGVTLGNASSLAPYDVILVAAAEKLSAAEIGGLDAFMRTRGGSVVLLLDQHGPGAYQQMTGVVQWRSVARAEPVAVRDTRTDSTVMLSGELAWPAALPRGARAIASANDSNAVVWELSRGAGRLIVSSAEDAWRYRDPARSQFASFWRTTVANAAAAVPAKMGIHLDADIVDPDDVAYFAVHTAGANVRAVLRDSAGRETDVRTWPVREGERRGFVRAPAGFYRLAVSDGASAAEVPIVFAHGAVHASPDERDLVQRWAEARGGSALPATRSGDIGAEIRRRIKPAATAVAWYPMRSAWWIIPFALALSWEWYWRRRRALL